MCAWAVMLAGSADAAVWQVAPSASPNPYKNFLTAVARVPGTTQFWAAGYTLDQVGPAHSLIEASSGGAFVESPLPRMGRFEQLLGIAAASPAHAWAVGGSFVHASLPLVFVWDGSAWRRTPAPLPSGAAGGTLMSVRAFSATDVTAVGTWFSATGGRRAPRRIRRAARDRSRRSQRCPARTCASPSGSARAPTARPTRR